MKIPILSPHQELTRSYWHPETQTASLRSPSEAGELFGAKLRECVSMYLRSDVPVGTALSGGLDSSSVAVLVNSVRGPQAPAFHTFTSTFPGDPVDERQYVDAVLEVIDAVPHFVTPTPEEFLADLDRFLWIHDEPPTCLSVYAAYRVAGTARDAGIPVTLNGQGGDEILAGYWQTYFLYLYNQAKRYHLAKVTGHFLGALTPQGNHLLVAKIPMMLRRFLARRHGLNTIPFRREVDPPAGGVLDEIMDLEESQRRLYQIRSMFLPRLLKWEDRNSMAFSVEGRYPFLDHELIELCQTFAPEVLFHNGWTKWPLRLGLSRLLPRTVACRKSKLGFEVPQNRWLRRSLRGAIEDWLASDGPIWQYLDPDGVRTLSERVSKDGGEAIEEGQALVRMFLFSRWLQLFGLKG